AIPPLGSKRLPAYWIRGLLQKLKAQLRFHRYLPLPPVVTVRLDPFLTANPGPNSTLPPARNVVALLTCPSIRKCVGLVICAAEFPSSVYCGMMARSTGTGTISVPFLA